MEYKQELSLELNSNTAYSTVGAKQGDNNSRVVIIHVTENGVDYNLNEHGVSSAYFRLRKPDGKAVINTATISEDGSYVSIVLTSQALAVAGRGYADVTLMTGSQILSTISFILLIMASPSIAEQATSSNEFGYLNAVVEDATHTIYEAEAWAAGTRGGQPVYNEDNFIVQKVSEIITSVSVDETTFMQKVGSAPGLKRVFTFSFTADNNWSLVTITYEGNTISKYNPEIIGSINDYGIILGLLMGSETPNVDDQIIITVEESDKTYHNNAKYYSELAHAEQEKIENLTVSAESALVPGVEKTENLTTGSYNLNFFLPKGDVGNVNLMTLYIDTDLASENYGQVIVVRPDSMLATDFVEYPDSIIFAFDRVVFLNYVGIDESKFKTYTFVYNNEFWYLDGNVISLEDYGITYRLKVGQHLQNNDKISLRYIEQVTFSINNDGDLVIGIDTEGI